MTHRPTHCLYDHNHNLQVFSRSGYDETRNLNVNVADFAEYLQIKVRDAADFVFNYTTNIDGRTFESMRNDQSLDINFDEFRANLIEMLHQVVKQEMFLKCESDGGRCRLIFYGKSRIKSIIFLTVDLQATDQQEIFNEMNNNLTELQTINKQLTAQLQNTKKILRAKDGEIADYSSANRELRKRFMEDLQNLSYVFSTKLQDCCAKLTSRILGLLQRLLKLVRDVEYVKIEASLKSDSSARLLQSMESLRLESIETSKIIDELKRENCALRGMQGESEKTIAELARVVSNQEKDFEELRSKKEEIEKDVKQAAVIIAQKSVTNEELAKDLVQANQMLVNFNHLYDTKNKEIEELQGTVAAKDEALHEQNCRYHRLLAEFEDYKCEFSAEKLQKMAQDLFAANRKIEEIEKLNRETVKLNELLTRKLASGDFARQHFHH